jgi:hypothetical protein
MSRPLRIEFPNVWYHVMNRARLGQEAFHARRGVENEASDLAIYLLRYIRSERLEKIGEEFNLNNYSSVSNAISKGLRKSNFTELAPKFRLDLVAPIEQNHRNSIIISRILRLRRRQRWPEDGMRKCEVIFTQALR